MGKNVMVVIVDDGLDMYSCDFKDNYFVEGFWDFNDNDFEFKFEFFDDNYGICCVGEVVVGWNDYCGVGVVYDVCIVGICILSKFISDVDEVEVFIYKYQDNQIYFCLWGFFDDGQFMEVLNIVIKRVMVQGV